MSYSLRKITDWLKENNINNYSYIEDEGRSFYRSLPTGMYLKLNDTYSLSIQTDYRTAAYAFCETMLINDISKNLEYNNDLGYSDPIRHYEQDDLFEHIKDLIEKLNTKK